MYWNFLLLLFVASIVMPFAFAILSLPSMGIALLVAKFTKVDEHPDAKVPKILTPVAILGLIWTFLILTLWAAYCAGITLKVVSHPDVTHDWFYYLTAFFLFTSPLSFMASKEPSRAQSVSFKYIFFMSLVLVAFCVWPILMHPVQPILTKLPGFPPVGERAEKQQVSELVLQTLRQEFVFDEMVELFGKRSTRTQLRERLSRAPAYAFLGSDQQEGLLVDAYLTQHQSILATQFYYHQPDDQLAFVLLLLRPNADAQARNLQKAALQSLELEPRPPVNSARLHFLGTHRLTSEYLVKISLREDVMSGKSQAFSIDYGLSKE